MPNRKLVRRPEWELHNSGPAADPSGDWRRSVLQQVGYDEVARERVARRTERRRVIRRFLGGVLFGLVVFASAFALLLAARLWREGRFDRYLPQAGEAVEAPLPHRRARMGPADVTERQDSHVIQQNPFAPPPHAPATMAEPDEESPAQTESTPGAEEG